MSQDISVNNKRIAKNTLALYCRTFITMLVGLYTGRVMLQALGVDNYGINAVVGGIVSMSSLITVTMSQAISRYITFALGKGDKTRLHTMFSTSINAQIVMALIATVVIEIVGVWFLNRGANIPAGRMDAANWVLQCSVLSLAISLINSPFNALIIAHERMSIYAYMSIVEVVLKLAICFAIMTYGGDRLILLALLQVGVALLMSIFYGWYCGRNFEEAHYNYRIFDKSLLKELTIFSGWNFLSDCTYVFATQGVNMLVNVFFGVVFNASRSVASTVDSAVQGFVSNFTMAFTPQITKSYAAGEREYAMHLVNKGSKFSWLMMYIFIVPVCMEADTLLQLWLGDVPEMAALFLRLTMFQSLIMIVSKNLYRIIQADGRIKKNTVHAAITTSFIFILVWVAYLVGAPVWWAYLIFILDYIVLMFVRLCDVKRLMDYSIKSFFIECVNPCMVVSVVSFIVPMLVAYFMPQGLLRFFVNSAVSVLWTGACCVVFGLTQGERMFFWNKTKAVLAKYGYSRV